MIDPARSFDRAAEEYERSRPGYPTAVLDGLPLDRDAAVVDIGAGTGKLTRVLTRRFRRVIAVEPLDGMRSILARVVPEAEVLAGSAEGVPLGDASVDGAFAGQAFHWFANDEAVAELARVLRPGGVLCLVWNSPDPERPSPLPRRFRASLEELHAAARAAREQAAPWQEVIARGPFGEVREQRVPHDHVLDRSGLLENASTISSIASRTDGEREEILRRLGELLPEDLYAVPNLAQSMWAVRR